jgi:hypothetical protein
VVHGCEAPVDFERLVFVQPHHRRSLRHGGIQVGSNGVIWSQEDKHKDWAATATTREHLLQHLETRRQKGAKNGCETFNIIVF